MRILKNWLIFRLNIIFVVIVWFKVDFVMRLILR